MTLPPAPPPPPPAVPPPGGAPLGGVFLQPPGSGSGPPPPVGMVERNPLLVVLWAFLSCGVYCIYWLYRTTLELKEASADASLQPKLDLLLVILTCGLWGIYVMYRNAKKTHELLLRVDAQARDRSVLILALNVAGLLVGASARNSAGLAGTVAGLVAILLLQEEYNKLARLARR